MARSTRLSALAGILALPTCVMAEQSLVLSGFATITAGSVIDGGRNAPLTGNPSVECPCIVTDWANNGIYQKSTPDLSPDSKLGAQLVYRISNKLSATGQLVSRGTSPRPDLQWAYASWTPDDHWQLDAGRKRIPLYFYSDFQDVGFAYPWVSPPGELYGWESTNYDGANLRYRSSLGSMDYSTSFFGGSERVKDNPYVETYSTTPTETRWDNLIGGDVTISQDWWTLRAVYAKTDVSFIDSDTGTTLQAMEAYGLAFNASFENWFLLTEVGKNNRNYINDGYRVSAPAYSIGAGYKINDKLTIFANTARYEEDSTDEASYNNPYIYSTHTLSLRWMINTHQSLKLQLDKHEDGSPDYSGDSTLVRLSWDASYWTGNLLKH